MTTISRMTPTIPRGKIIGQANWRPAVERSRAFLEMRRVAADGLICAI